MTLTRFLHPFYRMKKDGPSGKTKSLLMRCMPAILFSTRMVARLNIPEPSVPGVALHLPWTIAVTPFQGEMSIRKSPNPKIVLASAESKKNGIKKAVSFETASSTNKT